jgi:hypothetical protein
MAVAHGSYKFILKRLRDGGFGFRIETATWIQRRFQNTCWDF